MLNYRITKFDPAKRKPDGSYQDHFEWTSITDIGKPKYRNPNYEEYERIEDGYVQAILLIMKEKGIGSLAIKGLERYDSKEDFQRYAREIRLHNLPVDFETEVEPLQDGYELTHQIAKVIRLILREIMWMELVSDELTVTFGYDYYMYANCDELTQETIRKIEANGLFVEPGMGRREILIE